MTIYDLRLVAPRAPPFGSLISSSIMHPPPLLPLPFPASSYSSPNPLQLPFPLLNRCGRSKVICASWAAVWRDLQASLHGPLTLLSTS